MLKQRIIKVCLFTVMIGFHLCLNSPVLAEDCADREGMTQTPTPPGNAEYAGNWRSRYRPIIYASSHEIAPEGTITLHVDSGGLACPPYQWSVSGGGYTIQDDDGDQETDNDLETITLTAPASTGTCGTDYDIVTTVTVEDDCGITHEIGIRNTSGQWVDITSGWNYSVKNPECCGVSIHNDCVDESRVCRCYNPCSDLVTEDYCPRCVVSITEGRYRWCVRVSNVKSAGGCDCDPPADWAWDSYWTDPKPPCGSAGACYYTYEQLQEDKYGGCPEYMKFGICEWSCP